MFTPGNVYRLTTATSIPNSGIGSSVLTKPAGTEVASIVPRKKYSVYIPSAASFTTNFSLGPEGYTIHFYAKPEPGVILEVDNNEVIYTGHSYTLTNDIGESIEIPVRSNAARLIVFSYSNMEMSLSVDGESQAISANTTSESGTLDVSVLASGGIVDNIVAGRGSLSTPELLSLSQEYTADPSTTPDTVRTTDDNRDFVQRRRIIDSITLEPGEYREVLLRATEPSAFKIEYTQTGDVIVNVNNEPAFSGISLDQQPDTLSLYSESGGTIKNLDITEYYDNDLVSGSAASFSTNIASGTPAPTHKHDDSYGTTGDTIITSTGTVNTISGWFYATNGDVLPTVTMTNGVLSGTGLYVNGKPYSGGVVRDWYFLSKTGNFSGTFTVEVPVHALSVTSSTLNATQIDDLYESFFGNPVLTLPPESLSISDQAGLVISTEWDIVASG